jgi:hypothetical protein
MGKVQAPFELSRLYAIGALYFWWRRLSEKNHPHRQAYERRDAESYESEKNLAHQTITEAKGA